MKVKSLQAKIKKLSGKSAPAKSRSSRNIVKNYIKKNIKNKTNELERSIEYQKGNIDFL